MSDTQTSEWIEHDGKGMPVDGDTIVHVLFRDGDQWGPSRKPFTAKDWDPCWDHQETPSDADITHYRVVKP